MRLLRSLIACIDGQMDRWTDGRTGVRAGRGRPGPAGRYKCGCHVRRAHIEKARNMLTYNILYACVRCRGIRCFIHMRLHIAGWHPTDRARRGVLSSRESECAHLLKAGSARTLSNGYVGVRPCESGFARVQMFMIREDSWEEIFYTPPPLGNHFRDCNCARVETRLLFTTPSGWWWCIESAFRTIPVITLPTMNLRTIKINIFADRIHDHGSGVKQSPGQGKQQTKGSGPVQSHAVLY